MVGVRVLIDARRQSRRVGARIPLEARVIDLPLVQPCAGEPVVPQLRDRHVLLEVHRFRERAHRPGAVVAAEVPDVGFVTRADAQLRRRMRVHRVVQLAEEHRLAERRCKVAVVLREVDGVQRGECAGRWQAARCVEENKIRAVLIVPLVRSEEEQPVPLDRATDAQRRERPRVIGLCEADRRALEGVQRDQALVLVTEQYVAGPIVRARPGRRGDDRA